jgi:hypothetical protein
MAIVIPLGEWRVAMGYGDVFVVTRGLEEVLRRAGTRLQ